MVENTEELFRDDQIHLIDESRITWAQNWMLPLKGFERITLAAGETKNVSISLNEYSFRYFNVTTDRFETEGGKYDHLFQVSDREYEDLLGRPIPDGAWKRSEPLQKNDALAQMEYAKNPLARFAAKFLKKQIDKKVQNGTSDLNLLFVYNMPFRGMAKLLNGMISMDMTEDMVYISNGHFFRGTGRLIKHFMHRPKMNESE